MKQNFLIMINKNVLAKLTERTAILSSLIFLHIPIKKRLEREENEFSNMIFSSIYVSILDSEIQNNSKESKDIAYCILSDAEMFEFSKKKSWNS